ncbi:hypothetical protein [Streptomyces sp. NPDC017991]
MNMRLTWSRVTVAIVVAVAAVVLLVYGTHALTIIQRIALRVF